MAKRRYQDDEDEDDSLDEWEADDDAPDEQEMVACPYCRKMIFEDAVRCPKCGNYISEEEIDSGSGSGSSSTRPMWILITAIILLIVFILGAIF